MAMQATVYFRVNGQVCCTTGSATFYRSDEFDGIFFPCEIDYEQKHEQKHEQKQPVIRKLGGKLEEWMSEFAYDVMDTFFDREQEYETLCGICERFLQNFDNFDNMFMSTKLSKWNTYKPRFDDPELERLANLLLVHISGDLMRIENARNGLLPGRRAIDSDGQLLPLGPHERYGLHPDDWFYDELDGVDSSRRILHRGESMSTIRTDTIVTNRLRHVRILGLADFVAFVNTPVVLHDPSMKAYHRFKDVLTYEQFRALL